MSQTRNTGVVKWFDSTKGYGFIKVDGSEQDVFVHISAIADPDTNLESNERVAFSITQGQKGPQAQDVRRL